MKARRGPVPGAARLLRVLKEIGPAKRTVMVGLLKSEEGFERAMESLLRRGLVRVIGARKSWRLAAR